MRNFSLMRGNIQMDVTPISGKTPMVSFNHASNRRFFAPTAKGMKAENLPAHLRNVCGHCGVFHEVAAKRALDSLSKKSASPATLAPDNQQLRHATILHHAQRVYTAYLPRQMGLNGLLEFHGSEKKHAKNYNRILALGKKNGLGKTVEKDIKIAKMGVREAIEILSDGSTEGTFSPKNQMALAYTPTNPFMGEILHTLKGKKEPIQEKDSNKWLQDVFHHQLRGENSPLVGPLARFGLNREAWNGATKELVKTYLSKKEAVSFWQAPLIRAIELWQHLDEWENQSKTETDERSVGGMEVGAGEGFGWVESPDGPLIYRVEVNAKKTVQTLQAFPLLHQNEYWLRQAIQTQAEKMQPKTESEWNACVAPILMAFDPCLNCMGEFI